MAIDYPTNKKVKKQAGL